MTGQDLKGKVANDHNEKEKIPIDYRPKGEKSVDSRTKEGKKKKHIKKIVYYENESDFYLFDHFAQGRLLQEKYG
jgi:hypothetical protein